jgi:hypothetical protein
MRARTEIQKPVFGIDSTFQFRVSPDASRLSFGIADRLNRSEEVLFYM